MQVNAAGLERKEMGKWINGIVSYCVQDLRIEIPFPTDDLPSPSTHSGVTRVGDTRGGNWGCHPSLFFLKNLATFFCSSLSLSLSLFIAFTRVSPPPMSPKHFFLFYLSDLVFSTILCKFAHKFFSFECHLPGGCHPGWSAHPLSRPLVTPLSTQGR